MSKVVEVRPDLFVEIAPLSISDSLKADNLIGNLAGDEFTAASLMLLNTKVYTICSIRKVGSSPDALVPVTPLAGGAAFEGLANRFSIKELMVTLATEYSELEGVTVDKLKNESSEAGTDS